MLFLQIIRFLVSIQFILFFSQKWGFSKNTGKLRRQGTIVDDIISNMQMTGNESSGLNDSNDFGICLLKDSPYRILRVSSFPKKCFFCFIDYDIVVLLEQVLILM